MRPVDEDVLFKGRVWFQNLPEHPVATFNGITIEDVTGGITFKASGAAITITNFTGGSDGYAIRILGDGTTTISNNANIKTNTGANKLLAVNKIYTFTYIDADKVWYENG